jgi:hypothetical protein
MDEKTFNDFSEKAFSFGSGKKYFSIATDIGLITLSDSSKLTADETAAVERAIIESSPQRKDF